MCSSDLFKYSERVQLLAEGSYGNADHSIRCSGEAGRKHGEGLNNPNIGLFVLVKLSYNKAMKKEKKENEVFTVSHVYGFSQYERAV